MTPSNLISSYLWAGTALAFILLGRNGVPRLWFAALMLCLLLWPIILIAQPFLPKRKPHHCP